jgi:hypothetical protein
MPVIVATVDAMRLDDKELIVKKLGGTPLWKFSESSMLDFFERMPEHGVCVCPIELVKSKRTELDDLTSTLARVLSDKLGLEYCHVAIGCGGDPHEAFEIDISLGRRTEECLEDAYARGRVLNDERAFREVARALSIRGGVPTVIWAPNARELEFKIEHRDLTAWISDS